MNPHELKDAQPSPFAFGAKAALFRVLRGLGMGNQPPPEIAPTITSVQPLWGGIPQRAEHRETYQIHPRRSPLWPGPGWPEGEFSSDPILPERADYAEAGQAVQNWTKAGTPRAPYRVVQTNKHHEFMQDAQRFATPAQTRAEHRPPGSTGEWGMVPARQPRLTFVEPIVSYGLQTEVLN